MLCLTLLQVFFFKQKPVYDMLPCLEFRRVLFRSLPRLHAGAQLPHAPAPQRADRRAGAEDRRRGDGGAVRAAAGGYDGLTRWRRISMTAGSTEITMIARITAVKFRLTHGTLPKP